MYFYAIYLAYIHKLLVKPQEVFFWFGIIDMNTNINLNKIVIFLKE